VWFATLLSAGACLAATGVARADNLIPPKAHDPHYGETGFFDLHVCNWPENPLFFLAVFSTYQFDKVAKVEVFTPDGKPVGEFNLERYRVIEKKDKPEKRAFLTNMDIPAGHPDGWYTAHATMKDGSRYLFKDYVIVQQMPRPEHPVPADHAEVALPKVLSWDPIPGATYYKVFMWDMWDDSKQLLESKLLTEPKLELPAGLIKPGGSYQWRIHARDINEHPLLGDFNHGSLSPKMEFSVKE